MEPVTNEATLYSRRLYKLGSNGRIKEWYIVVYQDPEGKVFEETNSGYVAGKLKVSSKPSSGDAVKKAATKAEKKRREGYVNTEEEAKAAPVTRSGMQAKWATIEEVQALPMRKIIDEKYNGIRATYHLDTNSLVSKGNKVYDLSTMATYCRTFCDLYGYSFLDMELYAPGYKVNEIASMVKNTSNPLRRHLVAVVFDALESVDDKRPAIDRRKKLNADLRSSYSPALLKPNQLILPSTLDTEVFYNSIISRGGEGIITRNADLPYEWDNKSRRSEVMLKTKPLLTEEFQVVGCSFEERFVRGVFEKLILYTCVTQDGKTFTVTPEGSVEDRQIPAPETFDDLWYIVEFREYTVNGIPFHGVGKGFRIPEDMDDDKTS